MDSKMVKPLGLGCKISLFPKKVEYPFKFSWIPDWTEYEKGVG